MIIFKKLYFLLNLLLFTIEVKQTEQNRVQAWHPSQLVIWKIAKEVLMDVLDHVSPSWHPPILPIMFSSDHCDVTYFDFMNQANLLGCFSSTKSV